MVYNTRGLKRRRDTDKWEVTLAHRDPMTGEVVLTYHTVEATTRKKAEKARDKLVDDLERKGSAYTSQMTLREFLDVFIKYKEDGGAIERSTLDNYRKHARVVCRYLGGERLADVTIPRVNAWMAQMTAEGYAPRSVQKPFSMLRTAMRYAVAIDLITKNPCEFCKPPKIKRKKMQVLDRDERAHARASPRRRARAARPGDRDRPHDRHAPRRDMRAPLVGPRRRRHDIREPRDKPGVRRRLREGAQDRGRSAHDTAHQAPLRGAARHREGQAPRRRRARRPFGDPYILGTEDPDSHPYHPTKLTKDFRAFCAMNCFELTFHDLRHTFATMMIAGGTDVRTVASYLGHSNVAMTLNTYAEVDPDAKRAAVDKIGEAFDVDLDGVFAKQLEKPAFKLEFTVEQLEGMLAEAKRREAACA